MSMNFLDARLPHAFWLRCTPEPNTGCWLWFGAFKDDYGSFREKRAHRVAFAALNGAIPAGLVIDHTCRTPCCVNPDHLEAVTIRENNLRGVGWGAVNANKTVCACGLEFASNRRGRRWCRRCSNASERARRAAMASAGLCISALSHGAAAPGHTRCSSCLELRARKQRARLVRAAAPPS